MPLQTYSLTPVAHRTRRRIMRRIMPYLFFLYIIAYLDRVNLAYAALEMTKDLGFTAEVFGFGAGIFFIGYFLLEIPGALLVEVWSARCWIARIMISWGILAVLMGFISTVTQFYWVRFLLGAAEAGFFPGIIVYLSHWFRYEDRAKAVALFMAAQPICIIMGSPISGLLLGVHWFGMAGWRWLFILEGLPAVIFGVVTLFHLTDQPCQARWLADDEREWITTELKKEKQSKQATHSYTTVWRALRRPEVILLAMAYFLLNTSGYGLLFWLPTIVKKLFGLPNMMVALIAALPSCIGLIAKLLVGWSSDRTGERRWHAGLPLIVASTGFLLSGITQSNVAVMIVVFCLAVAGVNACSPAFWALSTSFLAGSAAAAAIGLINSVGNLGGFAGPYIVGYVNTATSSFVGSVLCLSLSALLAAGLILLIRPARQEGIGASGGNPIERGDTPAQPNKTLFDSRRRHAQPRQTVAKVVRMLQKTMNSFKINYGAWKTSVNEQQAVLVGNPFKPIPIEPLRLDYLQELK